ncbi:MAG: hypothetical protein WAX06_05995 [Lactococcus lactis]
MSKTALKHIKKKQKKQKEVKILDSPEFEETYKPKFVERIISIDELREKLGK